MKKVLILLMAILVLSVVTPVMAPPPYYHEEGNVNYSGSYFEPVYNAMSMGVDDYITIVDIALMARAYGTESSDPWGVGWGLYNPDADIDGDYWVDIKDVAIASKYWGLNYHYSPFETVPDKKTSVKAVAPKTTIQTGEQFTVDVAIKHVEGLNTYEFTLSWNPNLLSLISIVHGGFMAEEGSEHKEIVISADYVYVGDTLTLYPYTQSGSGVLARITFECLGKGKTTLDLSSRLLDIDLHRIPHKVIDGTVKQR